MHLVWEHHVDVRDRRESAVGAAMFRVGSLGIHEREPSEEVLRQTQAVRHVEDRRRQILGRNGECQEWHGNPGKVAKMDRQDR